MDPQGVPHSFRTCSYFHPPNIPQIPPLSAVRPQRWDNYTNLTDIEHVNTKDVTEYEAQEERVLLVQTEQDHDPDFKTIQLEKEISTANEKITA